MNDSLTDQKKHLSPLESFGVSLGFWGTFLAACFMYAILTLAPKLVEYSHLQRHTAELNQQSLELSQEVVHLERLANAIEHDEDFLARMCSNEFSLQQKGTIQISVPVELGFDARVPRQTEIIRPNESNWYDDLLEKLSSSTDLRTRWFSVMSALFLVSFLFMNETFFSGNLGRSLLRGAGNLFQRYRVTTSNLDSEGCQQVE